MVLTASFSLALQCSGLPPLTGGLKRGGFELPGDDSESSVLAAFQLVQSGWGQPGLPGWGSVVDNAERKGPINLEELVLPPAPPFRGKRGEYSTSVRGFGNHCGDMRSEGKGPVDGNSEELR